MLLANKTLTTGKWSMVGRVRNAAVSSALFTILGLAAPEWALAQQLLDDFNRPASAAVGGSWTETETIATGAQINASGQLIMQSTTAGREFVTQDVSGVYNTVYDANSCLLTWAFNVRQSRATPSGFAASNYGAAFVLGATSANLIGAGVQGYAVILGSGGNIRLVRFANGMGNNTLTDVIATGAVTQNNYWGIRVTFNPATNQWQMFTQTLTVGTFSSTSMLVGGTSVGTATDATYILTNLLYSGLLWNHSTGATESALFENVYVPQTCVPRVSFNTASALVSEPPNLSGPSSTTVNLTIFPASATGGTFVVSMGLGAGVAYTTDFTVSGGDVTGVVGSDITLTVAAGATSASFNVVLVDDALDEGNENITFTLSTTTGDLVLGTSLVHSFTIVDNDGPPSVSFTTTLSTVLEGATGTFNISISPTVLVATTVQIQITNGPGAVYGTPFSGTQDYYTIPGAAASIITVTIPANTATASFTAPTFYPDVGVDTPTPGVETVTFTIISASGAAVVAAAPQNTARLNISDRDALPMVLTPGDLVIVGINTNNGACSGNVTEDIVSFFCFKPITTGTKIIITDNGYARCSAGTWGNNEGTVEMTRTGVTIPPGQVITFRIQGSSGASNIAGIAPDAGWTCNSLNGFTSVDLNSAGDQLFFMQGGTWTTNTPGSHNATYTGTPLYGFSTTGVWAIPPVATCASSANNSLSGLPIGMQCFSMAPTSSTQFNKLSFANILTTALTQRNWVIAADATANWIAPPSCGSYNGAAPNWLLAPTLLITPGGFTPGLWRGTTSTDWFDCKNWDDVEVPLATTNVLIDETSANHCVIGITAGSSAVCASLMQTSSLTARNLTVQNNSGLAVGGPITVQRTVAGTAVAMTIATTAGFPNTLSAASLTVQGTAPTQAFFRNEGPLNLVTITGNMTIGTGGVVDISASPTTGGAIYVGGDYTNQGPTEATLDEAGGSIIFNGTAAQSISTASFQEVFYNLGVDKTTNNLTLNNPVAVRNVLGLTSGLLNTSATSLLTMRAGSSWTNATDASFVNGPMSKLGNTDFSFPIGKNNVLRPAGVRSLPVWPSLNFTAEYFPSTSYAWGIARESTLDHLSDCEHWLIDENVMASGTLNAIVELTWRAPYSCGVDNLSELRVARWDNAATPAPGIWRDRGNGGATGTFAAGTIPTAAGQDFITGFNTNDITAWTLASTTANNPLPVTLVEFTAKPEGSSVRLNWSTASEFENALFTVERSQYGVDFEHVLDVPGSMFSNVLLNYTELDRDPYGGLSYYRLRQTDVDGNFSYSPAVPVLFGGLSDRPLIVFGNSETITAVHGFPSGSRYALLDMTGRVIAEGATTMDGRTELNGSNLSRGAYVVRLVHGDRSESARFVY